MTVPDSVVIVPCASLGFGPDEYRDVDGPSTIGPLDAPKAAGIIDVAEERKVPGTLICHGPNESESLRRISGRRTTVATPLNCDLMVTRRAGSMTERTIPLQERLVGLEEYLLLKAAWHMAIARWPGATSILRHGARIVQEAAACRP
jgi:hypothetical protein